MEEDVPDAIVDLLEPDVLPSESLRKEPLFGMESKGAGVTDPPDFDVSGVFGRRERFWKRTR